MLFQMDNNGGADRPVAPFYAMELVNKQWIQPGSGQHKMFMTTSAAAKGKPVVTAYALRRPDGRLSVLLFNKDPKRAASVRLETVSGGNRTLLPGKLDLFQYSSKQFVWNNQHPRSQSDNPGTPALDLPPTHQVIVPGKEAVVVLPPDSISVVRTEKSIGG